MFEKPPTPEKQEKPSPFEQWLSLEFKNRYETKAKILNRLGLLEILPESQDIGIAGIDGKEYPFPRMETIEQKLRERQEFFETKILQGLSELEIIPFALPFDTLTKTLKRELLKHHQEGRLFRTKKNPDDPNEELKPFDVDENNPFFVADEHVDLNGKLVYDVKEFSDNHRGKTKQEMIEELSVPGYLVILREKNMNIPREGKGETKHNRKQLEANKTSKEYLRLLQTDRHYEGESGQTPEEWVIQFLTHLAETDQVIDDWQGNGSASFQVGAYLPASGRVPRGYSVRDYRRALVSGCSPDIRIDSYGVRSAVRV